MEEKDNPVKVHKLELLGIGASMDRQLKANLLQALWQLGLDIPVEEVREIDRLLESGVSGIPALIVNGQVVIQKVVPTVEELRLLLFALLKMPGQKVNIRNIIVPTDFSETANNAYRYALDLAGFLGANVRLVHVYQPKSDMSGARLMNGVSEELHYKQELLESLSHSEKVLVAGPRNKPATQVQPEMINGFVADELCALSRRKDTDLIVMGTTGEAKLLERWLGSISTEVARKASCPVILVPRHSRLKPIDQMLYACDYQRQGEAILEKVVGFAAAFDAMVHLLHVSTSRSPNPNGPAAASGSNILDLDGIKMKMYKSHHSDVLEGIARHANETHPGLIAMGTYHRSFLEDIFHKKLTREMAFITSVPLIVFHEED